MPGERRGAEGQMEREPQERRWQSKRPVVAFGPEMPTWGSWNWVGADTMAELSRYYETVSFSGFDVPSCDILFIVKHAPPESVVQRWDTRTTVVYCPIDFYGSAGHIDADRIFLRHCDRVLVHRRSVLRYFQPYAVTAYMDHHIKYDSPVTQYRPEGFVLWVGARSNLPALIEWLNRHPLDAPLRVLTNAETPEDYIDPTRLGFRAEQRVLVEEWTPELHRLWTSQAKAAIDIKGTDFRATHKPPAKALDFIASGVPIAMNPDSCVVGHLAEMGFEVPSPLDVDRWFSKEYCQDTVQFGSAIRELLSLRRVGLRYKRIIDELLAQKTGGQT